MLPPNLNPGHMTLEAQVSARYWAMNYDPDHHWYTGEYVGHNPTAAECAANFFRTKANLHLDALMRGETPPRAA